MYSAQHQDVRPDVPRTSAKINQTAHTVTSLVKAALLHILASMQRTWPVFRPAQGWWVRESGGVKGGRLPKSKAVKGPSMTYHYSNTPLLCSLPLQGV